MRFNAKSDLYRQTSQEKNFIGLITKSMILRQLGRKQLSEDLNSNQFLKMYIKVHIYHGDHLSDHVNTYRVYLKPASPSIDFPPASTRLLARMNLKSRAKVMMMMSPLAIMVAMIPGLYPGLSCSRNTVEPTIPPRPPAPTNVAEQRARFHWPRMLFACHVSTQGTLALQALVARKTPK